MNNQDLPTDELKKYGILNTDNSFTKKLSTDEVQMFLEGKSLIADNEKNRVVFQLIENNSKLDVKFFTLNQSIKDSLPNSTNNINYYVEQYNPTADNIEPGDTFYFKDGPASGYEYMVTSVRRDELNNPTKIYFQDIMLNEYNIHAEEFFKETENILSDKNLKVLVYDENTDHIKEYDLLQHEKEILNIIQDKNDLQETNRFLVELNKLRSFLQDKIDKFPNVAKDILVNLNIVSNVIDTVNGISEKQTISEKQNKTKLDLDVNDPDLYQDANRMKEEEQNSRRFKR